MKIRISSKKQVSIESENEVEADIIFSMLSGTELRTITLNEQVKVEQINHNDDVFVQPKSKQKRNKRGGYATTCPVVGCSAKVKGLIGKTLHMHKKHGVDKHGDMITEYNQYGKMLPVQHPVYLHDDGKYYLKGQKIQITSDTPESVAVKVNQAKKVTGFAKEYLT